MGISGRIARFFLQSRLTPLIALIALLLGGFALLVTPREEEPQIDVTMANVLIPFPGASAKDVETLVATPAEQVISQMPGLEHVFSVSKPGMAVVTAQFKVGVPRIVALVRLYDTILSNKDWLPTQLGVGDPLIKPKGIDDVPIVSLTLWTRDQARGAYDLEHVAHAIEVELKRVPGTREVTTIGGPGRVLRVLLDPERLAAYGLAASDLQRMLQSANTARPVGDDRRRQQVDPRRDRRVPEPAPRTSLRWSSARPTAIRCTCPTSRASSTAHRRPRVTSGSARARPRRPSASTRPANSRP